MAEQQPSVETDGAKHLRQYVERFAMQNASQVAAATSQDSNCCSPRACDASQQQAWIISTFRRSRLTAGQTIAR